MAAGKPVICLDIGGPATLVTAKTGFCVPAGTPEQAVQEMAGALQLLYDEPQRLIQMSAASMQRIIAHYTTEQSSAMLEELYTRLEMLARTSLPRANGAPVPQ